jgi:hypothetical protein
VTAGDDAKDRDSGRRTVGPLLGGVSVRPARWSVTSRAKGRSIWRGLMPNGDQISWIWWNAPRVFKPPRGRTDGRNPKVIGCPSALALIIGLARQHRLAPCGRRPRRTRLVSAWRARAGHDGCNHKSFERSSRMNKSPVALLSYRGGVKQVSSCGPLNHQ